MAFRPIHIVCWTIYITLTPNVQSSQFAASLSTRNKKKYLGLTLAMGIVKEQLSILLGHTVGWLIPLFAAVMPRNHYGLAQRFLHFNDNDTAVPLANLVIISSIQVLTEQPLFKRIHFYNWEASSVVKSKGFRFNSLSPVSVNLIRANFTSSVKVPLDSKKDSLCIQKIADRLSKIHSKLLLQKHLFWICCDTFNILVAS